MKLLLKRCVTDCEIRVYDPHGGSLIAATCQNDHVRQIFGPWVASCYRLLACGECLEIEFEVEGIQKL